MGLLSRKETCVICGGVAGLTRSNTSIGPVCKDCMDKLTKKKVTVFSIKKHSIEELQELCGIYHISEDIPAYDQLENMIIKNPTMTLNEEEVCFYYGKAQAYHTKNVVTGRKSAGAGLNVRVARGLSVNLGGGDSTLIRETIGESFDGKLYLTNQRIVLLSSKYGFDVKLQDITSFDIRHDGFQIFQGAKCYAALTDDINKIVSIIQLMNKALEDHPVKENKTTDNKKESSNAKSTANEIREYKKLLDEGIITQEEFDAKKKQLLGI